jgi:hypothetical protein
MESLVPEEEIYKGGAWCWNEGIWHQYTQKHAYGHRPFGVNFHEVSIIKEVSIGLFNAQYLQFLL